MALENGLKMFLLVEKHLEFAIRMSKGPEQIHNFLLPQVEKHHRNPVPTKTCGSAMFLLVPLISDL